MAFSKRMRIPVLFLLGMFLTPVLNTLLFRQILYPVPAFPVPAQPPSGFEEVRLPLPKGGTAHAWARLEPGARAAVVLLHGNGENLRTLAYSGILNDLADLGVSFLALDYPGYGRSTGRPSEKGNVAAALAGLEWLEERQPEALDSKIPPDGESAWEDPDAIFCGRRPGRIIPPATGDVPA